MKRNIFLGAEGWGGGGGMGGTFRDISKHRHATHAGVIFLEGWVEVGHFE